MTCVQLTWSCPTENPPLSVGKEIDGDWPPVVGHARSMTPKSTSARPRVEIDWTSGPRPARAGPKTMP